MSPIQPVLATLGAEVADLTAELGRRVDVAEMRICDREGQLALAPPGLRSPNRACRLVRAADGWIAVSLAREEDRDLVPAWLGCDFGVDPWTAILAHVRRRNCAELVADAALLGIPVSRVGETTAAGLAVPLLAMGAGASRSPRRTLKVVDLSALWAGPMCGAILAEMGASVVKVESVRRPDPTRTWTPEFSRRLNGRKSDLRLDLAEAAGQARLWEEIAGADVLITGARPRALVSLGLSTERIWSANPGLVWVAITGYGWTGDGAGRVGFGDDAAAAGGLLRWTPGGAPRFLGDALSDPVTGLAAAVGALRGLSARGGVLIDAALARCAAAAAAACGLAIAR